MNRLPTPDALDRQSAPFSTGRARPVATVARKVRKAAVRDEEQLFREAMAFPELTRDFFSSLLTAKKLRPYL